MATCKKCGCEIPSGQSKCDACKRKQVGIIRKVIIGGGATVATVMVAVLTTGKIKLKIPKIMT